MMPYGLVVRATYKGQLGSENMLQADGNSIGDAWAIGDNIWVWIAAPGAGYATWIDP
jgi:hypothetical protein